MPEAGARALVVGGSGGLGAACCLALADDGWDVTVGYGRNLDGAQTVADGVRERGRQAEVRPIDLQAPVLGDLSAVGTVVFAAGPAIEQPYLSQTDPAEVARVLDLETLGFFRIVQQALPRLRECGGSVVALVSAGLRRWPPGDGLSVIPKAAVEATVRGLAREEGRHGVRANAVAVGVIDAGMFHRIGFDERWLEAARKNIPLGRFGTAAEIGSTVAFLASDRASYLTGQTLAVDGGYTA